MIRRHPSSPLFPYTTLFRSHYPEPGDAARVRKWLAETGEYADDLLIGASDALKKTVANIRAKHPPLALKDLARSEEHTSELQSLTNLVCRLLLEKKKKPTKH